MTQAVALTPLVLAHLSLNRARSGFFVSRLRGSCGFEGTPEAFRNGTQESLAAPSEKLFLRP